MGGWTGADTEIQWKKLSMLQAGMWTIKILWSTCEPDIHINCLSQAHIFLSHSAATWQKQLLQWSVCTKQFSQAKNQGFSPFVLYKYQEYCIPFVFSWSILCKYSTVLRKKHWTEAWKPPFEYTVWFLIWETGLGTYLYHISSKAFCKDDWITSCIVIWKWKILS